VTAVNFSPANPTAGSPLTVQVSGNPGTIGSNPVVLFTPAALANWPAGSFQLSKSNMCVVTAAVEIAC